jgi:hypothetical protein
VSERENDMLIEGALPADLWQQIRHHADAVSGEPGAHRWRTVRALLLLMGDSGLRRGEAAGARREALRPSTHSNPHTPVRELTVVGKRKAAGGLKRHGIEADTLRPMLGGSAGREPGVSHGRHEQTGGLDPRQAHRGDAEPYTRGFYAAVRALASCVPAHLRHPGRGGQCAARCDPESIGAHLMGTTMIYDPAKKRMLSEVGRFYSEHNKTTE